MGINRGFVDGIGIKSQKTWGFTIIENSYYNIVYDLAYDYGLEHDVTISVNIKNEEHFNYWLGALPYYDNIKREGIVLAG